MARMKFKTALIAFGPGALVIAAIAYFNPVIMTWPVVATLAIVIGGLGAAATTLLEPKE